MPSAISDLVQGAINQPMSLYEMGPAAHAMERVVIEWMTEKVGWPAGSGGVLTHGGSLANLTVLLAARAAAAPDAWVDGVDGTLAVLAPPGSHYSVKRSVAMLGLGERAVVDLEVDEYERIVPAALGDALERCEEAGRRPMALVAAACATSTGLHDDLEAIGAFCREHGIWFHVDAAHGATALLSPDAPAPPEGHRARRLGDLGRPQDDAHAGARRRGAPARRAPARGGLPPEGGLPDLRGLAAGVREPPGAPGGVHQGRARDADLHEPGLPRRGGDGALRGRAVRQDGPLPRPDRARGPASSACRGRSRTSSASAAGATRPSRCACASGCSPSSASTSARRR